MCKGDGGKGRVDEPVEETELSGRDKDWEEEEGNESGVHDGRRLGANQNAGWRRVDQAPSVRV